MDVTSITLNLELDEMLEHGRAILAQERAERERKAAADEAEWQAQLKAAWEEVFEDARALLPETLHGYLNTAEPDGKPVDSLPRNHDQAVRLEIPGLGPMAVNVRPYFANGDDKPYLVYLATNCAELDYEKETCKPGWDYDRSITFDLLPAALAYAEEQAGIYENLMVEYDLKVVRAKNKVQEQPETVYNGDHDGSIYDLAPIQTAADLARAIQACIRQAVIVAIDQHEIDKHGTPF